MKSRAVSTVLLLFLIVLIQLPRGYGSPMTVSTDKPEYYRGETVRISISGAPPNVNLGLQVSNPVGGIVFVDQIRSDSGGGASTSFRIPPDAPYGTYTISVAGGGDTGSGTFRVVEYAPPPPPPPPPAKESSSMSIGLDRTMITLGENVTITGSLTPGLDVTVSLRITCPNGTEVSESIPAQNGLFTRVFKPDAVGVWSIRGSWEGNAQYYGCTSNTVTLVVRGPVLLQMVVAPMVTGVGGTIVIYVSTTPLLVDRPITFSYTTNKTVFWTTIGTFETGSGGFVACVFTPTESGKYVFKAEWVGDPAYMPASATSPEVLVTAEPLTAEDILKALSQVEELKKLLEEKEEELKNCVDRVSGLQKNLEDLQKALDDAQNSISSLESQLSEAESRLAEAESRAGFTSILGLIVGLIIGLLLGYLVFRRRRRTI